MSAASLAALAGVPGMWPRRLRSLLRHHDAEDAFERLAGGRPLHPMFVRGISAEALAKLRVRAADRSPAEALEACDRHRVAIVAETDPGYPSQLTLDPDPPPVLFVRGDLDALAGRRVGLIGTRNATAGGRATAVELGAFLASAGVAVVSGLARGIDAAGHCGVRSSGGPGQAVAVVGNGLDQPYPRQNSDLWHWVGEQGVIVSEWPPGVRPEAWRFPLRNRIIAALSEVLVVVESRERGGSLITAREAADRGVEVMAVPGSPRSRASFGTNKLLFDGAAPVTEAADVLDMLGLDHRRQGELPFDPRPRPDGTQQLVLDACASEPRTIDSLVTELGLGIAQVALAAARLERNGWLAEADGWFETSGSRLGRR